MQTSGNPIVADDFKWISACNSEETEQLQGVLMKSLGLLEISGVTAAVTALDIMCKTADVEFVTWERKLGGRLVTIIVQGEVAAVRQAVEAAAANGIKKPVNYTVIARPHEEVVRLVELSASRMKPKASAKTAAPKKGES